MARAGPETKARMLKGLGLKGYLVSDGKNPINLFNTANGLMGS
jgi:major vault protein